MMKEQTIRISAREKIVLRHYNEVSSTNDLAWQAVAEGAGNWTVISASGQTQGRGRQQRQWMSAPNMGLWLSLILRPDIPVKQLSLLNLTVSLAVREFLEDQFKLVNAAQECLCRVKWPNDVWVNGKKISGILLESRISAQSVSCLIIGIGINVNHGQQDLPGDLLYPATSLRCETGHVWPMVDLREALLQKLYQYLSDYQKLNFAGIVDRYQKFMLFRDRDISITTGRETLQGKLLGIDSNGFLKLKTAKGIKIITAGDVFKEETGKK